jgi:hypothetical protein
MIVAQINILRHRGCWASDTSLSFPTLKILIFLHYYDDDHYEIAVKFVPENEKSKDLIPKALLKIGSHPLWWETSPEIGENLYLIKIRDRGKTEGIIRPIIYERDAVLPLYQVMEAYKGKEIVYAVFHSKRALRYVKEELQGRVGKRNVQVTTIREDAREEDVVDLIPTWFDHCVEKPYGDLIKEAIKLASKGEKLEPGKFEKLKDYLVEHPEIFAVVLTIMEKMYNYLTQLLAGT